MCRVDFPVCTLELKYDKMQVVKKKKKEEEEKKKTVPAVFTCDQLHI